MLVRQQAIIVIGVIESKLGVPENLYFEDFLTIGKAKYFLNLVRVDLHGCHSRKKSLKRRAMDSIKLVNRD
jgi:hypothetical protein